MTEMRVTSGPSNQPSVADGLGGPIKPMMPVLGKKNYTQTLGRTRRTQILDENTKVISDP